MLDEDGNRLSLSTKSQQLVNKIWNLTELTFKMNKYIGIFTDQIKTLTKAVSANRSLLNKIEKVNKGSKIHELN